MTTRAVKTLTRMKAKNVVEEMRAGLTPISFFIKKPGPPPEVRLLCGGNLIMTHWLLATQVDSEAESDHEAGTPGKPGTPGPQALTGLVARLAAQSRSARRDPTTTTTR